jgi:hypothetical protein
MARPKLPERPTQVTRSDRPKRVPINGYRNILTVEGQEPGWHYVWVNDATQAHGTNNVPRFEDAGYQFVEHSVSVGDRKINSASQVGGKVTRSMGNGVTGYLMRLPQEDYDSDQAALQAEINESERGLFEKLNSKTDGQYGNVKLGRGQENL